jgi:IS5 family transposase
MKLPEATGFIWALWQARTWTRYNRNLFCSEFHLLHTSKALNSDLPDPGYSYHAYFEKNGLKVSTGPLVDATIIVAPGSTKNQDKARDPDMHSSNKGNQWYFSMKAHIGVDRSTSLIHTMAALAAK